MTQLSLTRSAFIAALALVSFSAPGAAFAARNADAERYVQSNAAAALHTLGDTTVASAQRRQTFDQLMARFADIPRIAVFVLGRYGGQLRADANLRNNWTRAFQDYMIAVYETQLDRYSGGVVRVIGSTERVAGRDVVVLSQITPRGSTRPLPVQWRLLRSGEAWKVVDISLLIDGNEIWLAQQQQRDFLAALDGNRGDINALMTQIRNQTAAMRGRQLARS